MFKNITHKLIISVGFVTIVIVSLFAYINITSLKEELMDEVIRSANQFSETVKNSTRYDMLKSKREEVRNIIETVGTQEGIEKMRIMNKTGTIKFSSDEEEIGELVDKKEEACYACHSEAKPLAQLMTKERNRIFEAKNHRILGIITPIYNEKDCYTSTECHVHSKDQRVLGVLDINMDLTAVDRKIYHTTVKTLVFALIEILGISFIIAFVTQRIVLKPVKLLVNATEKVAAGDFNCNIPINTKDEIGILAGSFNKMTEELRIAYEKLFQSEKQASLGRLSAGIAHEINNPLTGVLMFSTRMQKKLPQDWDYRKELDIIVRETIRCRDIVKGLLDFARQGKAHKEKVPLKRVIENALNLIQNKALIENIDIETDIPENLPDVLIDENQMQQVFINLFVNASDAMNDGGILSLKVRQKENNIEISVKDTGEGIPKNIISKIFEPFFTTKAGKGTGLGLAVVWGIIQEHSGKIEVNSQEGKGTEFLITFPVEG